MEWGAGIIAGLTQPSVAHQHTAWLFLRLLALIYLAAFASLIGQLGGLVGPEGIFPFEEALAHAQQEHGRSAWLKLPTLFWLDSSSRTMELAAWAGCGFSLLLFFNRLPLLSLIALFSLYLSLFHAGQLFLNFQWDYLLLEAGFLSIFIARGPPSHLLLLLFHWLLFRLRFLSGISKVISGDPTWSGLTALNFYFETQPLPHLGAWYAHQLPEWILQAGVVLTLFAELVVPFFIFLPRRFRLVAAGITIAMQLMIIATSNHNFFNLLTILLCLFLLDDRVVGRLLPGKWRMREVMLQRPGRAKSAATVIVALLILTTSIPLAYRMIAKQSLPQSLAGWTERVRRLGVGNVYHVFPVMQTERYELSIEGSLDGSEWRAYRFRYKPEALDKLPAFIVPHQPRLDWMVWFIPPKSELSAYILDRLMNRLWHNAREVTALLESSPFESQSPRYLRVMAYRYRFTSAGEKARTGHYWKREYLGPFQYVSPRRP